MEERPISQGNLPPLVPPDLSPEARRKQALRVRAGLQERIDDHVGPEGKFWDSRFFKVFNRVWIGAYYDGFIHAGNLAYMAILALFPFFITVGAGFSLIGEQAQREASVHAFLLGLPPVVAGALEPVAQDVVAARSGWLLWAGGIVGLWTVGSLIETIRDILRRAYGTQPTHAFWRYRLSSTGVIIVAVIAMVFALLAQVAIGAVQQIIEHAVPRLGGWIGTLTTSRLVPAAIIYLSLWLLFLTLTPTAYRGKSYPKWPGALLVTGWWIAVSMALPPLLGSFFSYDLTYGSLAGVMIALFFFWLVGLGMVMGAELNAALTESPEERDAIGQGDNRHRRQPAVAAKGPQGTDA